ncbi:MAG: hypothetical protein QM528_05860, partial [Phycisphaerales bacterium]|nr:hypothetical protein [Phycisphaerales bacterium]
MTRNFLKVFFLFFFSCFSVSLLEAQVNIGLDLPIDPSTVLQLSATRFGFLLPRMDGTNRDAIISPATGLMIFNTSTNGVEVNFGTPLNPVWGGLYQGAINNAYNGLTQINTGVVLGGLLTMPTLITATLNNPLMFSGLLSANPISDSILMLGSADNILKYITPSDLLSRNLQADNGLYFQNNTFYLGGTLTRPTVLTTSGVNTLSIQGLSSDALSDTILVQNGSVRYRLLSSLTNSKIDTAVNGLTKINDSVLLGGDLTRPTVLTTSGVNTLSIQGLSSD